MEEDALGEARRPLLCVRATRARCLAVALALALASCHPAHEHAATTLGAAGASPPGDQWGPLVTLRDDSDMWLADRPDGGWWVSPVHVMLLPSGRVLITGWDRHQKVGCAEHEGFSLHGVTFVFDPATSAATFEIAPIDAQDATDDDSLYCAGHVPLPGGRVFYAGGTRLLGGVLQSARPGVVHGVQHGLDYARVFDALSESFVRVAAPMLGAPPGKPSARWYPTATRLHDGRVLVTGGLTACCEASDQNRSVELFDETRLGPDATGSPWELLVSHDAAPPEIEINNLDYPHVVLLPRPVLAGGRARQIAVLGSGGTVVLGNYRDAMPESERFFVPPNGARPGGDGQRGLGSTAALLPTGEILVAGHKTDPELARTADLYDPATDAWRSVDLGVARGVPTSVLLPDGTVLIANGFGQANYVGGRAAPQVFDPATSQVTAGTALPAVPERGYHSFALLLKDGSVLIGGGTTTEDFSQSVHCESPTVQVYHPPYFRNGPRPVILGAAEPLELVLGGAPLALGYAGPAPRARGGVVLMALGAVTHAFDQNQRYVPLRTRAVGPARLEVAPPDDGAAAPPGDYLLFFVSDAGVPSRAKYLRVRAR